LQKRRRGRESLRRPPLWKLLETAVLAQKPFEQIVEPIAQSFDESGMSEEELDDLVKQTREAIREERRRNK
jgi:hypothetical protein